MWTLDLLNRNKIIPITPCIDPLYRNICCIVVRIINRLKCIFLAGLWNLSHCWKHKKTWRLLFSLHVKMHKIAIVVFSIFFFAYVLSTPSNLQPLRRFRVGGFADEDTGDDCSNWNGVDACQGSQTDEPADKDNRRWQTTPQGNYIYFTICTTIT